ncbi:MAG: MFS transporter [Sedimentisphaerales bacterium]
MRHLFKDTNLARLGLAAFFMGSTLQFIGLAVPFVVKAMKGSDTAVGGCFLGQMGVYVFFCIMAGLIVDKFNPRKIMLVSSFAEILVVAGFIATVWFGTKSRLCVSPVMILTILMSLMGIVTAFFWPVMSGWISTGYEGAALSKRFGFFNISWGLSTIVLPVIAGYLVEINYVLPMAAAGVTSVLCFAAILSSSYAGKSSAHKQSNPEQINAGEIEYGKTAFIWMARVAILATAACIGLFRSQLGIFYKFQLGFTESNYGWAMAIMCVAYVSMFYSMGSSHWWHYKKIPFVVSSFVIFISMLTVFLSGNIALQFLAAALGGISYGFAYSSHQYYGVSGGKNRSRLMAVHEIFVGGGLSIGALFGGMLSDAFGRYSPYKYACGFIIAAAVAQAAIWFFLRKK